MTAVIRFKPELAQLEKAMTSGTSKAAKAAGDKIDAELSKAGRKAGDSAGKGIGKGVEAGATDGAKRGGEKIEQEIARATSSAASKAQRLSSWGNKLTLGITAPVVLGIHKANQAFESFQDETSAMGVFYGEQSAKVSDWAKTNSMAYHMSELAATQMANGYAPLIQQFAATEEQGQKAIDVISRTADMASFFGGSINDAQGAVQSFLSGSSVEPIRRYGVFASEAAVQAKALAMGLVKADVSQTAVAASAQKVTNAQAKAAKALKEHGEASNEYKTAAIEVKQAEEAWQRATEGKLPQLDDATKIQARLAILMEQTSQAEGDSARTADSAANKHKDLAAAMENASIAAGRSLEPAMSKVYTALAKVADVFSSLPDGAQSFIVTAALIGAAVGPLLKMVAVVMQLRDAYLAAAAARAVLAGVEGGGGAAGLGGTVASAGSGMFSSGGPYALAALAGTYGGGLGGKYLYENDPGYKDFIDGLANTWVGKNILAPIGGAMSALPGLASGGTVHPDGRIVHLAEGGQPEDVVPHDKRSNYAAAVLGVGGLNQLAAAVADLASQPRAIYVTVDGRSYDERELARHLDALSRQSAATTGRARRNAR